MVTRSTNPGRATLPRRRAILLAVVLLLVACAPAARPAAPPAASDPAGASAAPRPELNRARIIMAASKDATNVADGTAFKLLEDDYGVTVDYNIISGAGESIKTLLANQADFALSTFGAGITAVAQEQPIVVVAPSAFAAYFVLLTEDKLRSWADFRGATVGITATNDSSYYTTVLLLKKYGIDPAAVNWITVRGSAARGTALAAGKISAGQVQVAQVLELTKQPGFRTMGYPGKKFPNLLFSGYWVRKEFAERNPRLVQAFAEAMLRAQREMMRKDTFMARAQQWVPEIPVSELEESYRLLQDMDIWDPDFTRWNAEAGDYTAQTLTEYEATEKSLPFNTWATTRFADSARQRLGAYRP